MRICILHNAASGKPDAAFAYIREAAAQRPDLTLVEPEEPEDLYEVVADATGQGYDVIAAAGGDGTVHLVANALMAVGSSAADRPALAVLPLGTGNDYARTLSVPLDPNEALALIGWGDRHIVEVIRIESGDDAPCFAINLCSGGFTAELHESLTSERKERWGPLAYALATMEALPDRTVYETRLVCDDRPEQRLSLHGLVVASGRMAGGGKLTAPTANPEDGVLDIVAAKAGTTAEVAGLAARTVTHADIRESGLIESTRARRVRVESRPPMRFVVDGEPKICTPVTFSVVPNALRVIVGEGYRAQPEA